MADLLDKITKQIEQRRDSLRHVVEEYEDLIKTRDTIGLGEKHMGMALKKQRKRQQRRKGHQSQMKARNEARGFSANDLQRTTGAREHEADTSARSRTAEAKGANPASPAVIGNNDSYLIHPTEEMMQDIRAQARIKKQAFKKVAQFNGWKLIGTDPKKPENWQV